MEKESDFQGANYYVVIPQEVLHDNRLTPLARLIYGEISALANINGYAWISNKKLAIKYKVTKATISAAISKLQEFEYIRSHLIYKENSKEVEKRNLYINPIQKNLNTLYKNNLTGYAKKSDEGVQKNLKNNNTSNNTMNNTNNNIADKSAKLDLDKRFDSLWKMYPNKKGKSKALTAYKRAIKSGVTDEEIQSGIENYLAEINAKGTSKDYIKHGSTWFNSKGWEDDYDTVPRQQNFTINNKVVKPAPPWSHGDQKVEYMTDEDRKKFWEELENGNT